MILPPIRRAFIQLQLPGQEPRYFTLAERQPQGDIELLAIDPQRGKITLRYRGSVVDVAMRNQPSRNEAVALTENQRDASHIATHVARAQTERARDEQERRQAAATLGETP